MEIVMFLQVIFIFILSTVLTKKKLFRKRFIFFEILFSLIMAILYKYVDIFGSFFVFFGIIIMFRCSRLKWIDALHYSSMVMICVILGDHIVSFVMEKILGVTSVFQTSNEFVLSAMIMRQIFVLIVSSVLLIICKKVIIDIIARGMENQNLKYILGFFSFFTYIIYFTMIVYVRITGSQSSLILMNTLYLFIYFTLFIISLSFSVYTFQKNYEMKEKKTELKNMRLYTEKLERNYTEIRRFRHDYINILASMSDYIANRDIESLEHYFNTNIMKISHEIQNNNFKMKDLSQLKVREVKGLISSKLITAQEKGLDVAFECPEEIDYLNVDSVTLCRCVGILLDNAIEAATESEEKQVRVAFVQFNNSISFVIWNSFVDEGHKVFKYFEKGFSTKGENRGLGLTTLKELIAKVTNVQLDTYIDERQFKQEIKIMK